MSGWLALCLMAVGVGLWLATTGMARLRPDPVARALAGHPLEVAHWRRSRSSWIDRVLTAWDQRLGGHTRNSSLAVLRRNASEHRGRQLRAGVAGSAAGAGVVLVSGASAAGCLWAVALLPMSLALVEWDLRRAAVRRRDDLADHVTTVSEYLALCATAGLTAAEAFDHAARHASGPMRAWLVTIVADVRSGRPLEAALTDAAASMDVPAFDRLTDTVLTAAGRGTPLAATLVAQAQDSRSAAHARLLEQAGRAEVAMLVPIVGLVLPAVVAVAVYPGLTTLMAM